MYGTTLNGSIHTGTKIFIFSELKFANYYFLNMTVCSVHLC